MGCAIAFALDLHCLDNSHSRRLFIEYPQLGQHPQMVMISSSMQMTYTQHNTIHRPKTAIHKASSTTQKKGCCDDAAASRFEILAHHGR